MNWTGIAGHNLVVLIASALGILLRVDIGFAVGAAYFAREAAQWIDKDHWGWATAFSVVWRSGWDARLQGLLPLALGLLAMILRGPLT